MSDLLLGIMKYKFLKYFFIISLLWLQDAASQPALIKASIDKNKILLGEPLWFMVEIKSPQGSNIQPIKIDSIPHFEFLKKDSIVRTSESGLSVIKQYYKITSFDSGRWVIPPFLLRPNVKTPSILVDVVFSDPFDPAQPYHDVQQVRSVPFKMETKYEEWWYPIFVALIFITLLYYWFRREKKTQIAKQAPAVLPYDKAMKKMGELQKGKLQTNIFYARLVDIFRAYVAERTGIESLHQSSNELVEKLKPVFDEAKYKNISQVLYLCDFVKFAKHKPAETEARSAFETIEQSINHIEHTIANNKGSLNFFSSEKAQKELS